jgi:peptidoglycan L-alanyl-D-glutamate endopeptidase CwlK
MKNSRDIKDLLPVVAFKATAFVAACRAAGIDVLITSTLRDGESQDALYAQGRTTPGQRVTNARAGQSMHNYACAFDFVPIVHGKAMWDDTKTFARCGAIAESLGLEWGGRWTSRPDMPHCQYTGGLTLADLQSGKKVV